jgi:putative transposase
VSTRDFKRALQPLLGESGLSQSSISRVNKTLKASFMAWRKRDLSEEKIVYLFLDGYYLGVRKGGREKDALLIAHGVRADGSRVLLGVYLGGRESTEGWNGVLQDLHRSGDGRAEANDHRWQSRIVAGDEGSNASGRSATLYRSHDAQRAGASHEEPEGWSEESPEQNLPGPLSGRCTEGGLAVPPTIAKEFPTATEVLADSLADCLTFYRFPESHWKRIRTSNVLKRAFLEVRRRTDVIRRPHDEMSALALVFGVLEEDRLKWRGLKIDDELRQAIVIAFKQAQEEPIRIVWAEKLAA